MKTPFAIRQIQKISYDYIKIDCPNGGCYGVLAVHRICFALALFHAIIGASLIGVKDTRSKRAAIQNGWWGPKILLWLALVAVSFVIPNPFFIFWGNYVSLVGATLFILLGLVLLVDFAHSWSETCLEKWEASESNLWQYILIGSTAAMYIAAATLTGVMYGFFASDGCTLNRFFISFNLALCVVITIVCIHPAVQEANPRSGLAQSSVVAVYCTYLIMSAVGNNSNPVCRNPLHERASATRTTTVVFGAIFTFIAIAYCTSRAATQSRALVGKRKGGAIQLGNDTGSDTGVTMTTSQPSRTETPRYQAMLAAVEAGAIPASALDEDIDEEDDDGVAGDERDDERTGTRYNVRLGQNARAQGYLLTNFSTVCVVPCHLFDGSHVCSNATHRVVCTFVPSRVGVLDLTVWTGKSSRQQIVFLERSPISTLVVPSQLCGCVSCPVGFAWLSIFGASSLQCSCRIGQFKFSPIVLSRLKLYLIDLMNNSH